MQKNELAVVKLEKFAMVAGGDDVREALRENLGDEGLSIWDLDRIKIPAGGGLFYTVNDAKGEPQPVKTFDAVCLFTARSRGYWPDKPKAGEPGKPPECRSQDMVAGHGAPGGTCAMCAYNQFGSGTNEDGTPSNGKACKEQDTLFLMFPDSPLPRLFVLPPTSLKPKRKAFQRMAVKSGLIYWKSVLRFGLDDSNGNYSVVTIEPVAKLSAPDAEIMKQMREDLVPHLKKLDVSEQPDSSAAPAQSDAAPAQPAPSDALDGIQIPVEEVDV